jgi:hypothetical protein
MSAAIGVNRYSNSKDTEGPNVLNAWTHGDLITVDDIALVHVEHSSMYQRNEDIWKDYPSSRKADYSRADGIVGYAGSRATRWSSSMRISSMMRRRWRF